MTNPEEEPAQARAGAGQSTKSPINLAAWLGPVVTIVGAVSYFVYFVRFPDLRDFPWVNLPLVGVGAVLSGIGFHRALWKPGYRLPSKIFAAVGAFMSSSLAGLFVWYIFSFSYQMPPAEGVVEVSQPAPAFSLQDEKSQNVSLTDFRGKNLVVTFYRGFW